MDSVQWTQTMLENETVGGGDDRVCAKVDRADRTVFREVALDSPQKIARSCDPTSRIGRTNCARELEARDLTGDHRLALP